MNIFILFLHIDMHTQGIFHIYILLFLWMKENELLGIYKPPTFVKKQTRFLTCNITPYIIREPRDFEHTR